MPHNDASENRMMGYLTVQHVRHALQHAQQPAARHRPNTRIPTRAAHNQQQRKLLECPASSRAGAGIEVLDRGRGEQGT